MKYYNDREKVSQIYYPNQTSTVSYTYTGSPAKPPAGVTVGKGGATISSQGSPAISATSVATVITYTESGFSPTKVALSGTNLTVKFINRSKSLMWPLAAPFENPTFSSQYGLQPGESFTATLPAGSKTYLYYNRLHDTHRGTITIQ